MAVTGRRATEMMISATLTPAKQHGGDWVTFAGQLKTNGVDNAPYEIPTLIDAGKALAAFKLLRAQQKGMRFMATYGYGADAIKQEEEFWQDWTKADGHLERINLAFNAQLNEVLRRLTTETNATSHILRKIYAAIVVSRGLAGGRKTPSQVRIEVLGHGAGDDATQAAYDTVLADASLSCAIEYHRGRLEGDAAEQQQTDYQRLEAAAVAVADGCGRAKALIEVHSLALEEMRKGATWQEITTPAWVQRHLRPDGKQLNFNTAKKFTQLISEDLGSEQD
jgi:hypothetical protein